MPSRVRWLGLLLVLGIIGLWEGLTRSGLLNPSNFPPITTVGQALFADLFVGKVFVHMAVTLRSYAQGLALALAVGIPCGVLMGAFPGVHGAGRILLEFLRPIPSVAVIPVAVLLLGVEVKMRSAVVFYASLWPILLNTLYGIHNVDPVYVETARVFGRRRADVLRVVVLPAALPYIFTGARIASGIALVLAITSEMVAGTNGLGYYVKTSEMSLRVPEMYGGILLTGLLGYLLNVGFSRLEQRALGWYSGSQGQLGGG